MLVVGVRMCVFACTCACVFMHARVRARVKYCIMAPA